MNSLKIGNLNISIPIIQGGMGVGVSLSGLAAAVANEGGVGVLSCAGLGLVYKQQYKTKDYLTACIDGLKEEIRKTREMTKGIVGINIMGALSNYADMVRTSIEEKIDIIFSGAGLPLDLPQYLTSKCHTKLVPIVSSARAAKILCQKWKSNYDYLPDAIVVEGPKAGGHLGFKKEQLDDSTYSLEELVTEIVSEVGVFEEKYDQEIPVIAAGGLYSGNDIYQIMQKGAKGVQLGSRFVTTVECDADDSFKQTYINASESDFEIIQSPVGMPGRALKNNFLDKVREGLKKPVTCPFKCLKTCEMEKSPYCIIHALYNAARGRLNSGYVFAGTKAYMATKIMSVKETFKELLDEVETAAFAKQRL